MLHQFFSKENHAWTLGVSNQVAVFGAQQCSASPAVLAALAAKVHIISPK